MKQAQFYITANDTTFPVNFAVSGSADAFRTLLQEGDLTIHMRDYGSFEKVGSIGTSLPRQDTQISTTTGDVMLYQGDQIVVFYGTNRWSYSRLGKVEGATAEALLSAFGSGDVSITFCQLQLNYIDWHFQNAKETVELLQKAGIPVWVMEPLRGGKLAKASAEMTKELHAMRPEETVPAWAFRFLQAIPGVTMVLSGMSNLEQIQANIVTWQEDQPLNPEEFDHLVALADAETRKAGLPCTACHYCTAHCPRQLPIPELIALYNEHKITGGGFIAPMAVDSMPEDKRPANCIGCQSCEQVCPQQIKFSEMKKDFTSMIGM